MDNTEQSRWRVNLEISSPISAKGEDRGREREKEKEKRRRKKEKKREKRRENFEVDKFCPTREEKKFFWVFQLGSKT